MHAGRRLVFAAVGASLLLQLTVHVLWLTVVLVICLLLNAAACSLTYYPAVLAASTIAEE
jgi:hypothetical protein